MAKVYNCGVDVYPESNDPGCNDVYKITVSDNLKVFELIEEGNIENGASPDVILEQDNQQIVIKDLDHLKEVYKQAKLSFQYLEKNQKKIIENLA